jgi:hypothetical protein
MWEVEGSAWGCSPAADAKGNAGFEGQPELAVWFRLQAFAGSAACSRGGGALACRSATRGQRLQRLTQEAAASFMGRRRGARQRRRRPGRPVPWPWPTGPRWAPRGPRSGRRRAEGGWVGPSGSAQLDRIGFLFFEIFFCAKTNPGNAQKMFRGTKNTQKITKIPGKFLEID